MYYHYCELYGSVTKEPFREDDEPELTVVEQLDEQITIEEVDSVLRSCKLIFYEVTENLAAIYNCLFLIKSYLMSRYRMAGQK